MVFQNAAKQLLSGIQEAILLPPKWRLFLPKLYKVFRLRDTRRTYTKSEKTNGFVIIRQSLEPIIMCM